jgi:hypothetical protein
MRQRLIHLSDESVDVLFPVAKITTLNEVLELAWSEASSRVGELERPQEVGGLLEVWSYGKYLFQVSKEVSQDLDRLPTYLVDQIFDADDAVGTKRTFNDGIVGKWNALFVDFPISTLVHELADRL